MAGPLQIGPSTEIQLPAWRNAQAGESSVWPHLQRPLEPLEHPRDISQTECGKNPSQKGDFGSPKGGCWMPKGGRKAEEGQHEASAELGKAPILRRRPLRRGACCGPNSSSPALVGMHFTVLTSTSMIRNISGKALCGTRLSAEMASAWGSAWSPCPPPANVSLLAPDITPYPVPRFPLGTCAKMSS